MLRKTLLTAALAATLPLAAHADEAFRQCLADLQEDARIQGGVRAETWQRHTADLEPDMDVVALLDRQPEFTTPIWDYMAGLVDDERAEDGRKRLEQWHDTLMRIEREYGVDPATVVAIWGVESNYGQGLGKRRVIDSLATLACIGRRQGFFRGELFHAMKIVQDGHIEADDLRGSWAGAFGQTQFMPSTFSRLAVDFDGDGRRDLMSTVPDALASTANYLQRAGWRTGEVWGFEVKLPDGFDGSDAGRSAKQPMSSWSTRGLRRVDGSALPDGDTRAGLLLPAGAEGPAFLVMKNFDALFAYNAAESYALAIAHLADRIRGGGEFVTPWPTDDPGLSRAERREVQELLIARGHDIGGVDGMIGTNTRRVIRDIQPELGLEPDGRAGRKLLEALRRGN
ncbi:MAG: lytic murein transglycosylase [Azoarcus sp.]|nr:lytic murein transglycosylase [Azoarcus sp.]